MKRKPRIQKHAATLLAALLFPTLAQASENAYDLLSKSLLPLLSPFMENPQPGQRAWRITGIIEAAHPGGIHRQRAVISLETPDKLRIDTTVDGRRVGICRHGKQVWGWPKDLLEPLLPKEKLPQSGRRFGSFQLPVNDAAVVFLPALLQIEDRGIHRFDGRPARVLDIALMPELAEKAGAENAQARMWIDPATRLPLRLQGAYNGQRGAFTFEQIQYARALPRETWQPTDEERGNIITLSAAEFLSLMEALTNGYLKSEI